MQDYFNELDSAREYLSLFGVNQAPCQGIEADDVIGWLTKKYELEGWKVIIYSNDKDYYQLTTKHVTIWRTATERFMSAKEVAQTRQVPPNRIHLLDGLLGQQKDNIPGACDLDEDGVMKKFGFGEAKALKLLCHEDNPHKTLKSVLRILRSDNPPVGEKFVTQILRNWKQVVISARLSRIRTKNRHYEDWEIEKLDEVYAQSIAQKEVTTKDIFKVASMLDIRMIDVGTICKKIGVNVKGKTRKKVIVKVA
jgi:5'-3' exonuclease